MASAAMTGQAIWLFALLVGAVAFALAFFVPSWTLRAQMEAHAEVNEDVVEWLEKSKLPFVEELGGGTIAYYIYWLQVPFVFGGLAVAVKLALRGGALLVPPEAVAPPPKLNRAFAKFTAMLAYPLQVSSCCRCKVPSLLRKMSHYLDEITVLDILVVVSWLLLNWWIVWLFMDQALEYGELSRHFLRPHKTLQVAPIMERSEFWSWGGMENLGVYTGILASIDIGWYLILPTARRSVLLEMLHLPWQTAIKYHRWAAWHTTFVTVLHAALYVAVWSHGNGHERYDPQGQMLRQNLLLWGCAKKCNEEPCPSDECDARQSRTLAVTNWGWAALFLMAVMCVSALPVLRRRCFECFYLLHQLWMPFLVCVQLHFSGSIIFVGPGIAMHCVDKALSALSWLGTYTARAQQITPQLVELVIPLPWSGACRPGQYVYINVPEISKLQWHPMSVTWSSNTQLALHIKALGKYTEELHKICSESKELKVKVDGFYGYGKDALLLWGGGVGLTYLFGVAADACSRDVPVFLNWVVRNEAELRAFADLLGHMQSRHPSLQLKLWVTRSNGGEAASSEPNYGSATVVDTDCGDPPAEPAHAMLRSWLASRTLFALVSAGIIYVNIWGYATAVDTLTSRPENQVENRWEHMRIAEIFYPFLFCLAASILTMLLLGAVAVLLEISGWRPLFMATMWARGVAKESRIQGAGGPDVQVDAEQRVADHLQPEARQRSLPTPAVGRPDVEAEFCSVSKMLDKDADVGVLACGPLALVHAAESACHARLWTLQCWSLALEEWEW